MWTYTCVDLLRHVHWCMHVHPCSLCFTRYIYTYWYYICYQCVHRHHYKRYNCCILTCRVLTPRPCVTERCWRTWPRGTCEPSSGFYTTTTTAFPPGAGRSTAVTACHCRRLLLSQPVTVADCCCHSLSLSQTAADTACHCRRLLLSQPITVADCYCHSLSLLQTAAVTVCHCRRLLLSQPVTVTACNCHSLPLSHHVTVTACFCHSLELSQLVTVTACHSHNLSLTQPVTLTACHSHSLSLSQPATVIPLWFSQKWSVSQKPSTSQRCEHQADVLPFPNGLSSIQTIQPFHQFSLDWECWPVIQTCL